MMRLMPHQTQRILPTLNLEGQCPKQLETEKAGMPEESLDLFFHFSPSGFCRMIGCYLCGGKGNRHQNQASVGIRLRDFRIR